MSNHLKTRASVEHAMLEKLATSGLDKRAATKLKMVAYTKEEVTNLKGVPPLAAGFTIPYFDLHGKPTSFWRFRYLSDARTGFAALTSAKPQRYVQAPKTVNELYLPPLTQVDWPAVAKDTTLPIFITEGELKAACACNVGMPTIGLGGVWNFRSSSNKMKLLPQFAWFDWRDRMVYIVYDSDAATNHQIIIAENALARELLNLGAKPHIIRLPSLPHCPKTGLDDFLTSEDGEDLFIAMTDPKAIVPWVESKELHTLNEEVVYVQDPGLIIRLDNGQKMSHSAFTDHAYSARIYDDWKPTAEGVLKPVQKSAPKEWLKWKFRAEVKGITYAPGSPAVTAEHKLNTWKGWGCEPVKGDISPFNKLMGFLFEGEDAARKWLEQWLAYPLQHPGFKMYTSVLLWSLVHGVGKTFLGYTLGKIYGENFAEISDQDLQNGDNDWAENKQFIMGDEISSSDKRQVADRLKSMITQLNIRINIKYVPRYTLPDCINYLFTSNHPDALFVDTKDRRLFIHEVVGSPLPDEFYKEYEHWLNNGGAEALFWHLLHLDLEGFNPKAKAMETSSKRAMADAVQSDLGAWCELARADPDSVLRLGGQRLAYDLWTAGDLLPLFDPEGKTRVTAQGLGRELRRAGVPQVNKGMGVYTHEGQKKLFALRNPEKYAKMVGVSIGQHYDAERGKGQVAPPRPSKIRGAKK